MSFILDALRKLEQERHHAGVGGAASSTASPGRSRHSRTRSVVSILGVALVSAVVTAGILRMSPSDEVVPSTAPPEETERIEMEEPREIPTSASIASAAAIPTERAPAPTPAPASRTEAVAEDPPAEPLPNQKTEPNIRLVGHDSPSRGSLLRSEAAQTQEEVSELLPRLVLQGTSVIDGEPVAVISDRRVFEGDHIEGALVIRIGERVVELEFDGQRFTLSL